MLAVTLPTQGALVGGIADQGGIGLAILATGAGVTNNLSITLTDQTVGVFGKQVVATLTDGVVTKSYFNFNNAIGFTGLTTDPLNTQNNVVSLLTPYGVNIVGDTTGTPALVWKADCLFNLASSPLATVTLTTDGADALLTTTAGGPSTIAGRFETPTVPSLATPGADISLTSNNKISVLPTGIYGGVKTWNLSLGDGGLGTTSVIDLQGTITTQNNVTLTDSHTITISQPIAAGGAISVKTAGIGVNGNVVIDRTLTADGAITVVALDDLVSNAAVQSIGAGVTLTATNGSTTVNDNVDALAAIAISGSTGVTIAATSAVTSTTGAVGLASGTGFVDAVGSLTAVAGAVTVNATALDASTKVVTALSAVTITAGRAVLITDAVRVTGAGSVSATAGTDIDVDGAVTVVGNGGVTFAANNDLTIGKAVTTTAAGNVVATATNGTLAILPVSPINVNNGTISLTAAAGTISIESQVISDLAITVSSKQGLTLSNTIDATAEVRTTRVGGTVTVTNDANLVTIDAPVTSQAETVSITCTNDDLVVVDNVFAQKAMTLQANTLLSAGGLAAPITLTSMTGVIGMTSTTNNVTLNDKLVFVLPGAASGLSLTAAQAVTLPVAVTAGGSVTVSSAAGFTLQQAITTTFGGISLTSANGLVSSTAAPLAAGSDIKLTGASGVTIDNALSSTLGGLSVVSGNGSVTISPTTTITVPSVIGGNISIDAATTLSLGIDLMAGYNLTVKTGNTFTPAAGIDFTSSSGAVSITVAGGNLDLTGSTVSATGGAISPEGSVTLSAANGTLTMGTVNTNPVIGNLTIISGLAFTPPLGALTVGGNLTVQSGGAFLPVLGADLVSLNGSISLTFTDEIDLTNINVEAQRGGITLHSKTDDVAVGTKNFFVDPSGVGGTVTLQAPDGLVTLGQSLVAGGAIAIESFDGFTSPALTSTLAGITITSANGVVTVNDALLAAADITATGFQGVTVAGSLTALAGGITVTTANGDVAVTDTIVAQLGTITLTAFGEIQGGATLSPVTAMLLGNRLVATSNDGFGTGAKLQFTNPANTLVEVTLNLTTGIAPVGGGVTFVNSGTYTVNSVISATGSVSLTSIAGGVTILGGVGATVGETLTGVTLTAVDNIAVTGSVKAAAGSVQIQSANGGVTIDGSVTASPLVAATVSATAANGLTVTGGVFAGGNVSLTAGTGATLGTIGSANTITSAFGDVTLDVAGGPGTTAVNATTVSAILGGIRIRTPGMLTFNAGTLQAFPTWAPGSGTKGLVTIDALQTTTATAPVVNCGRFELKNALGAPLNFNGSNSVQTLYVTTLGDLNFNNTIPLTLTEFTNAPVVQVSGQNITITSPSGLRVVDGITCKGSLVLTAASALRGVEFVPTATGDNPVLPFAGTLRDMIGYVNANAQTRMSVVFDESGSPLSLGGTVALTAELPGISKAVTIDGDLLPAAAGVSIGGIVGVDGSAIVSPAANGLRLIAGSTGSTLESLAIHGFKGVGVQVLSRSNLLRGLWVGADRDGNADGNGVGVQIAGVGAIQNVVGSTQSPNYILDSADDGLQVSGGANYTTIVANYIGIDPSGNPAGNGGDGVSIEGSLGTVVGGTAVNVRNRIGNNGQAGVRITNINGSSLAYGAQVQGNWIGDNSGAGVLIQGGGWNLVGGTTLNSPNTIERNQYGVQLISSSVGPTQNNLVAGNAIKANTRDGIYLNAGYSNRLRANTVASNLSAGIRVLNAVASTTRPANQIVLNTVSSTGTPAAAADGGIVVEGSSGQIIGAFAGGNIVTGNSGSGIVVRAGTGAGQFKFNSIVNNETGNNIGDGIRIEGVVATTVRGNTSYGNTAAGISIVDADPKAVATQANVVSQNSAYANQDGISVQGGAYAMIGGALRSDGNRAFSNTRHGIVVTAGAGTGRAVGAVIRNNLIGLGVSNNAAGNAGYGVSITQASQTTVDRNIINNNTTGGVYVQNADATTIGATVTGLGNQIIGNAGNGIVVEQPTLATQYTSNTAIVGNKIESNQGWGVQVTGIRSTGVRIGRRPSITQPDQSGNEIRYNVNGGVQVAAANTATIIGNVVVANAGAKQIEVIGGVAPPVLTVVTVKVPGQKTPNYDIKGTVTGTVGQRFYVDLYSSRPGNGSQAYLGRVLVTIGKSGQGSFRTIVKGGPLGGGAAVSATATLASTLFESTSEFSNSVAT